jgi:hypothetical protein
MYDKKNAKHQGFTTASFIVRPRLGCRTAIYHEQIGLSRDKQDLEKNLALQRSYLNEVMLLEFKYDKQVRKMAPDPCRGVHAVVGFSMPPHRATSGASLCLL